MEKIMIICRGIPGSGKTTFARLLGRAICSADDFFTHGDEYIWSADKVSTAHDWCKRKCRRFMKKQIDRIIVCNTNTTEREMKPYMDLALQFGYKVFSIIVENRHGGVSIHNVPEETLEKMRNRFEVKL
jgi:tRNA uridine 5-carbamoylmethylation protein Kti12